MSPLGAGRPVGMSALSVKPARRCDTLDVAPGCRRRTARGHAPGAAVPSPL